MKRDPQRPSTWIQYRSGLCQNCDAGCCTLPLEVNVNDLIRLELTDEYEAAESLKKIAQKLKKARIVKSFHPKSQLFILEQRNGRDCIYLDENRRCTVYEKRPEVCRQFPKIGPKPGWCPANPRAKK